MRYHSAMASCSHCGAARPATAAPCPACGAVPSQAPELELSVPRRPGAAPPRARREPKGGQEVSIDLAFDPRASFSSQPSEGRRSIVRTVAPTESVTPADAFAEARLLADYGDPPKHWLLSPFYAWRVMRRHRELKHALVLRSAEASRAAAEVEDALVVLAERIRSTAEQQPTYAEALEELRQAEQVLSSRDRVLAAENEAETARLASVDARLTKLESELAQAHAAERTVAAELVASQEALARTEVYLKRTDSELRAAQRDGGGARE